MKKTTLKRYNPQGTVENWKTATEQCQESDHSMQAASSPPAWLAKMQYLIRVLSMLMFSQVAH